jgi:hypothetical protein
MVTRRVRKMDCLGGASLIHINLLNAKTESHISSAAQPSERITPREIIVSGHSRASWRRPRGREDSLMTPQSVL